jgi:hypothetical protein
LNKTFISAKSEYYNSGILIDSSKQQSQSVAERLKEHSTSGEEGYLSKFLLTSVVGLGLLSDRLEIRNPHAAKYTGEVTILDGVAPRVTSTRSKPYAFVADLDTTITVDAVPTVKTVPAGLPAVYRLMLDEFLTSGGEVVSRFPTPGAQNFTVLIDNTPYDVSTAGPVADLTTLATILDGLLPVDVSVENGFLVLTHYLVGSSHRLALYGTGTLNDTFGLTLAKFGEVLGSDIFDTPEYSSTPLEILQGNFQPTLVGGKTVLPLGADHGVEIGDSVLIRGSYYHVESVTDTEATLEVEVLNVSTGLALVDPTLSELSVKILRDRLFVDGPVAWGGTITASVDALGFVLSEGIHKEFTLDSGLPIGYTLRIGDRIEESDKITGSISTVSSNTLVSTTPLTTTTVKLHSKGDASYKAVHSKLSNTQGDLVEEKRLLSELQEAVGTALSTRQNVYIANEKLARTLAVVTAVKSEHVKFKPNSTRESVSFIRNLKENNLSILADAIMDFRLYDLTRFTVQNISEFGEIAQLAESLVVALGGQGDSFSVIVQDEGTWDSVGNDDLVERSTWDN